MGTRKGFLINERFVKSIQYLIASNLQDIKNKMFFNLCFNLIKEKRNSLKTKEKKYMTKEQKEQAIINNIASQHEVIDRAIKKMSEEKHQAYCRKCGEEIKGDEDSLCQWCV